MSEPVTVVAAGETYLYTEGVRWALAEAPGIKLLALAHDGPDALKAAVKLGPDILLIDLTLLHEVDYIARRCPDVKIIVVSQHADELSLMAAMRAGARGYVMTSAHPAELAAAIRAVGVGHLVFAREVAAGLREKLTTRSTRTAFPELTTREHEVLEHLADGRSNAEIAKVMCLAPKTVRNHVSNVLTKLEAESRFDAAIRARDAGLGTRVLLRA
ncbi:response regulator [Herbidospora sp. NEAU-GS84]|uniref:Response regulator n=1 Tax=Herbidospora solisilvae TaxID=2696284 RepID=A0A7C9N125_9ACTN|nr:response regulator transcription factor [Herbidospora solisilvae]NAS21214.1 response regulator [Herbidospora solisilvae]